MNIEELINALDLKPHPEGGFYRETYRAAEEIDAAALSLRYGAARSMSTAIYYLLRADTFSCMHKVSSDEVFHFYLGDSVEQLRLYPDGNSEVIHLGSNFQQGELMQSVVPAGVWQGARLKSGGKFALLGATVAPGFDFADYEEGRKADLSSVYTVRAELIAALTRK